MVENRPFSPRKREDSRRKLTRKPHDDVPDHLAFAFSMKN
jgi:hypothetical protein